jgi:DNA-binding GntR family transcriptional regulator
MTTQEQGAPGRDAHEDELSKLMPLQPSRLRVVDQVHAALRDALADGIVSPGTRLLEIQVAAQLGASRTPVREAFQRLEAEGLAHRRRGRGLVFTEFSADDVADLGQIRIALDTVAARLASARTKQDEWIKAEEECERLNEAIASKVDTVRRVHEAHQAFHLEIYHLGFTPVVSVFLEANLLRFLDITTRHRDMQTPNPEDLGAHDELLRALKSGDSELAAEAAWAHAMLGVERVTERLRLSGR